MLNSSPLVSGLARARGMPPAAYASARRLSPCATSRARRRARPPSRPYRPYCPSPRSRPARAAQDAARSIIIPAPRLDPPHLPSAPLLRPGPHHRLALHRSAAPARDTRPRSSFRPRPARVAQGAVFLVPLRYSDVRPASALRVARVTPTSASPQLPPPPVAGALLRALARGRLLTNPDPADRFSARAVPSGSRRLGFASSSCPQYISPFNPPVL